MRVCVGSTDMAMGGPASVSYADVALEPLDVSIFDCAPYLTHALADI
jgi:hypothetical protein